MQNKLPKILVGFFVLSFIASMFLYLRYSSKEIVFSEDTSMDIPEIEVTETTESTQMVTVKEININMLDSIINGVQNYGDIESGYIRDCSFDWLNPNTLSIQGRCISFSEVAADYEISIVDYLKNENFVVEKTNSSSTITHETVGMIRNNIVCLVEGYISSYDPTVQMDLNNLDMSIKNISLSCGFLDQ